MFETRKTLNIQKKFQKSKVLQYTIFTANQKVLKGLFDDLPVTTL